MKTKNWLLSIVLSFTLGAGGAGWYLQADNQSAPAASNASATQAVENKPHELSNSPPRHSKQTSESGMTGTVGYDEETKESVPYAVDMLARVYGKSMPFAGKSTAEIAKHLNHLVFNYCSSTPPHTGAVDINELFSNCRTACGGYSHVLRGLLAAQGIRTRYSNFYNLPQQGNHTAVEVEIEPGQWSLFDPTFGVYFTLDGSANGRPLSTEEVRFLLDKNLIRKNVFMATKTTMPAPMKLDELYEQNFSAQYMEIDNYLIAEQAASVSSDAVVPLVISIDFKNGGIVAGSTSFDNIKTGASDFLHWTNSLLNNKNPLDDTSFLFHIVGNHGRFFRSMNVLRVSSLNPGDLYDIEIHGYAPDLSKIQITPIGKIGKLNITEPELIKAGRFSITRRLRPSVSAVDLLISSGTGDTLKIFGLKIASVR